MFQQRRPCSLLCPNNLHKQHNSLAALTLQSARRCMASGTQGFGFHRRASSQSLTLSGRSQATASRKGVSRGIAIARAPCPACRGSSTALGWGFSLLIADVDTESGLSSGLWVGLTMTSPDSLALRPGDMDFAADVPDSVVAGGGGALWDGNQCHDITWDTSQLQVGDQVHVFLSAGEFQVRLNGRTVAACEASLPLRGPFYPLVELRGCTKAVELLRESSLCLSLEEPRPLPQATPEVNQRDPSVQRQLPGAGPRRARSETPSRRHSAKLKPKVHTDALPGERLHLENGQHEDPRLWTTVRDCLARPENYDQVFHAVCALLCEARAERDGFHQRLGEAERANALGAAAAKRREAELRRLREELKHQAALLEESNMACQTLAKELTAAKDAKNRAQYRIRQLQPKAADVGWAARAVDTAAAADALVCVAEISFTARIDMIPLSAPAPINVGPPTPEMLEKMRRIRFCVIGTFVAAVGRFCTGDVPYNEVLSGCVGIFLLSDDPNVAPCYACLANSPLGQCSHGLTCVMAYAFLSGINAIFLTLKLFVGGPFVLFSFVCQGAGAYQGLKLHNLVNANMADGPMAPLQRNFPGPGGPGPPETPGPQPPSFQAFQGTGMRLGG
ncbi:unnamed protein product [Symbiodinium sp. KB8]|nr:unnamed protein product [Symbiodinium sp. KB8]